MSYLNISKEEPLTKYHDGFVKEYQLGPDHLPEGSYFVSEIPYTEDLGELRTIEFTPPQTEIPFLALDNLLHREYIMGPILVHASQLTDIPKYEVINQTIEQDFEIERDE